MFFYYTVQNWLRIYLTENGYFFQSPITGTKARYQGLRASALKRARLMAVASWRW
jgi:ribosomal protein S18